ncbi:uncharacterized protein YALI1_B01268g [Yarrowia lipolytica]|uniref:Uncharacterized protein n=1 Tax=Yarrowia lipolytica TaxID=4952 RepID=A0A1D8N5W5_YARLL|nr:hypothetical protein YALI1_B01268g [Yarrowia lipolytica]
MHSTCNADLQATSQLEPSNPSHQTGHQTEHHRLSTDQSSLGMHMHYTLCRVGKTPHRAISPSATLAFSEMIGNGDRPSRDRSSVICDGGVRMPPENGVVRLEDPCRDHHSGNVAGIPVAILRLLPKFWVLIISRAKIDISSQKTLQTRYRRSENCNGATRAQAIT